MRKATRAKYAPHQHSLLTLSLFQVLGRYCKDARKALLQDTVRLALMAWVDLLVRRYCRGKDRVHSIEGSRCLPAHIPTCMLYFSIFRVQIVIIDSSRMLCLKPQRCHSREPAKPMFSLVTSYRKLAAAIIPLAALVSFPSMIESVLKGPRLNSCGNKTHCPACKG